MGSLLRTRFPQASLKGRADLSCLLGGSPHGPRTPGLPDRGKFERVPPGAQARARMPRRAHATRSTLRVRKRTRKLPAPTHQDAPRTVFPERQKEAPRRPEGNKPPVLKWRHGMRDHCGDGRRRNTARDKVRSCHPSCPTPPHGRSSGCELPLPEPTCSAGARARVRARSDTFVVLRWPLTAAALTTGLGSNKPATVKNPLADMPKRAFNYGAYLSVHTSLTTIPIRGPPMPCPCCSHTVPADHFRAAQALFGRLSRAARAPCPRERPPIGT